MSNIEDDLKEKGFIEAYKQIKNNASIIKSIDKDFFFELVDYLLSEREQDKARIKELEEENASKQKAYDDCYCEYKHYKQFDSIPKQKVKDKIEEVKLSGGGNGKDNVENLARELVIDDLTRLLEEGE